MAKKNWLAQFIEEYNQLPVGESAEFEVFFRRFTIWSVPACVFFTYSFFILPEYYILYIVDFLPFEGRIGYLRRVDQVSYVAFIATVLSGATIFPFVVARLGREYWVRVVALGKCKPVKTEVVLVMIFQAAFGFAIFFMAFVDAHEPVDPRWPGMTRILLWPIFPFFGAVASWLLGILAFALSVGILKFIYIREG